MKDDLNIISWLDPQLIVWLQHSAEHFATEVQLISPIGLFLPLPVDRISGFFPGFLIGRLTTAIGVDVDGQQLAVMLALPRTHHRRRLLTGHQAPTTEEQQPSLSRFLIVGWSLVHTAWSHHQPESA